MSFSKRCGCVSPSSVKREQWDTLDKTDKCPIVSWITSWKLWFDRSQIRFDLTWKWIVTWGVLCVCHQVKKMLVIHQKEELGTWKKSLILWPDSLVCTVNMSPNAISHIRAYSYGIQWRKTFSLGNGCSIDDQIFLASYTQDCESKLTWILVGLIFFALWITFWLFYNMIKRLSDWWVNQVILSKLDMFE